VQARMTLGRLASEHSQDPRVQVAKSQLDQSFAAMAKEGEIPSVRSVDSGNAGTSESERGIAARQTSGPALYR
jgi:hypothetical protein